MNNGDIESPDKKQSWFYSDTVKEHFFDPQNFAQDDPLPEEYNGVGEVGSPACGDKMRVWILVNEEDRIVSFKWRTFGCGSAIAATSMLSVMITENGGMTIEQAVSLKPQDVMERLGGLPARKFHCSVLCDQALRSAIKNYQENYAKNKNRG